MPHKDTMSREVDLVTVKKEFPGEWKRLQERVHERAKPELPRTIFTRLEKRAKELLKGRVIEFGPTTTYPFIAYCSLIWEWEAKCSFTEIVKFIPRKGAGAAERRLVQMIDGQCLLNEPRFLGGVMRSPAVREYNQEIRTFCREGEALEKKFSFKFQEILDDISW